MENGHLSFMFMHRRTVARCLYPFRVIHRDKRKAFAMFVHPGHCTAVGWLDFIDNNNGAKLISHCYTALALNYSIQHLGSVYSSVIKLHTALLSLNHSLCAHPRTKYLRYLMRPKIEPIGK